MTGPREVFGPVFWVVDGSVPDLADVPRTLSGTAEYRGTLYTVWEVCERPAVLPGRITYVVRHPEGDAFGSVMKDEVSRAVMLLDRLRYEYRRR